MLIDPRHNFHTQPFTLNACDFCRMHRRLMATKHDSHHGCRFGTILTTPGFHALRSHQLGSLDSISLHINHHTASSSYLRNPTFCQLVCCYERYESHIHHNTWSPPISGMLSNEIRVTKNKSPVQWRVEKPSV